MGKREYQFNKMIRDNLRCSGFEFYRVENHGLDPGMPDIHFVTMDGLAGWIEVKDELGKMPHKLKYENGQVPWLLSYDKAGGFCCTVFRWSDDAEDYIGLIHAKQSLMASIELDQFKFLSFPLSPKGWEGLAQYIRELALQRVPERPANPGSLIREASQQGLVGAIAPHRKPN